MGLLDIVDGHSNYVTMYGVQGNQLGHEVISAQCTVDYVLKFLEVDRSVQRDMIEIQVSNISKYIQYGLDGNDIYFPPLIFSARGRGEFNAENSQFRIKTEDTMVILDGQHRIRAFEVLKKRLESRRDPEDQKKLNYIKNFPLSIQIFKDLTIEQERQLFTDVNTKSSKVSNTLLIMYKENDLYGKLVKDIIDNHPSISPDKFEIRAKSTTTKLMTAATLYNIAITLNDGIIISQNAKLTIDEKNYNVYKKNVEDFLTLLMKYAPDQSLDRSKYFILNPKVLQGIAKAVYLLKCENADFDMENLFQKSVHLFDWSQKNKELKQVGIPFNTNTKKYRFSVGTRVITQISQLLLKKYSKKTGNVLNV
ncbi:DGQHR domain-containing protein (plasmid) [Priestia megaterium]|uniref:DNA sulfur modification protein DndB n=1 Tax=Priestia megaterium TaxID=1404 RepID=UPI001EDC5516|nr:DNA sulfur modification protein DndB [Priestia megaterium]UKJ83704.1 DGQHR domain-containing protein [Priestia megaterium]